MFGSPFLDHSDGGVDDNDRQDDDGVNCVSEEGAYARRAEQNVDQGIGKLREGAM